MTTVAVVGATGNVGGEVARQLIGRGVTVRAVGRSADRLRPLVEAGAIAAVAEVEDAAALERAFAGAEAVFAMLPPNYAAPDAAGYYRAAGEATARALEAARVPRAVFLSSLGADQPEGLGVVSMYRPVEDRLRAVPGLHLAVLRPTYFMENLLNLIGPIRQMGAAGSPWHPTQPTPMIATRDIGAYAAGLVAAPAFTGHTIHELLGPRDYTHVEAATVIGAAIGRPDLAYVQFPYEAATQALLGMGMTPSVAEALVGLARGHAEGLLVSRQGRSAATTTPTTLEQFVADVFVPAFAAAG